jgi:hypothetical protein
LRNLHAAGLEEGPFKDGGLVDRVGLAGWRRRRVARGGGGGGGNAAAPPALIHLIQRSSAFSGNDDVEATGARCAAVAVWPALAAELALIRSICSTECMSTRQGCCQ